MALADISAQYQVDWDIAVQSQDVNANTSTVYGRLIVRKTGGYGYWSSSPNAWYVDFAGQIFSGNYTYDFRNYSELLIWQGSVTITHNDDGTKWIHTGASASMDAPSGNAAANVDMTLPTIPRATAPVLSAQPVTGTAITINLPRASSSFTHEVKYSFGSASGTIATAAGASASWTPPHSLLTQIPNSASGTGAITVTTKNGSTVIGTKSVGFTLTAASSQIPTLSSVTLAETVTSPVNIASVIGAYVQSQSKLRYTFVGAAGIQGSTIKSYNISIGDVDDTGSTGISDPLRNSGTVTVTATVTDSRGRKSTAWTTTISVLAWAPPNITSYKAERALSTGVVDPAGTYIKVTLQASVSSLMVSSTQKNTLTYKTDTSVADANSWTNKRNTAQGSTVTVNTTYLINPYVETSSWDVLTSVVDRFETTSVLRSVSVAGVALDLGLTNVGIAKFWSSGAADVGGDLVLNAMNGMTGKIDMPNGRILPVYSTTGLGSAGSSWLCLARLTTQNETVGFSFYGGENRTAATEGYSAKVHFKVRNPGAATAVIHEFGKAAGLIWQIIQNGDYDAELWVQLPSYRQAFKVVPENVSRYNQYTLLYPYGDEVATAPTGLTSTGVTTYSDPRKLDTGPFQVGTNGFTWGSGWSNYMSSGWSGVWIERQGGLVIINGACAKSSWPAADIIINIPEGYRPYRQSEGSTAVQIVGSTNNPGTVIKANAAGNTATSFTLSYFANA